MKSSEAYQSPEFVHRVGVLKRRQLRDLYPSEAWSLYRILPHCESVLDLGCGAGDMAEIVQQISPTTQYVGVDDNKELIDIAKGNNSYKGCSFNTSDAFNYLSRNEEYDCVMAWAFMYAVPDYPKLLELMISRASKYVLFDMRAARIPHDVSDRKLAHVRYGNATGPLPIASIKMLVSRIRAFEDSLSRVEMTGYYFTIGDHGWLSDDIPEPAIISVALEKASPNPKARKNGTEWHLKLPPDLLEAL